ncbi:hypothetical protein EV2_022924 [Malus domestica]
MPLREQWSAVEKAIMAEEVLQDVPIREEDNIWDYLDGPSRFEMEELRARRGEKKNPRVVTAGPIQPKNHHELYPVELSWAWVGHGSFMG